MKTLRACVLLALAAVTTSAVQHRDPTIRIALRVGQGNNEGAAESADDVRAILERRKPGSIIALATDGETPEMVLWLTRRFTRIDQRPGVAAPTQGNLVCIVQASLEERRLTGSTTGMRPVEAGDVIWRQAAARLVDVVARHVETRQHLLLQERADWPAVGFEFDALTKGRSEQLGVKDGTIVVTAVDDSGAGHDAGLDAGDIVLAADGKKLKTPADLARVIYASAHATGIKLELARGGERKAVVVTIP